MMDDLTKDLYLLFNDMNQDVDQYDDIPVTNEEIRRWKRNFRRNRNDVRTSYSIKRIAVAACAIFVIALAAGPFKDYSLAAIENVSYTLSEVLGFDDDISTYENMIGKSITKDGYTITINSVILDGSTLYLTYTERFPEKLEGQEGYKIYAANGIEANLNGTVNGTNHEISAGGTCKPIDDYTRLSIVEMHFEKMIDTSKPVKIKFAYEIYEDDSGKPAKVIDDIAFVADGSQLALQTEKMPLNYTYEFPDGSSVHFTGFEINPVSRKIFFEEENASDGFDWDLRMHDEFGNYIIENSRSAQANSNGKLEGCISYTAGSAERVDEAATELICEVWGGYFTGAPGEDVEGEYMEQIGEAFKIPLK